MAENTEKDIKEMTPEKIEELKYKQEIEKEKTLQKIIKGVNDVWEKEYNFEELDLHYTIKLRIPNAIEQGRIYSLRSSYLNGMDMYQNEDVLRVYQMLATIQVVGVEVPKEFKTPEEIYNLTPLLVMYDDWNEFLTSFRY